MTSVIKTSENAAKRSSTKIYSKLMEILGFSNFENIQILTKGKCYKGGFYRNCTQDIDLYKRMDLG